MKRQLFFLLVCLSLLIPGSGYFNNLNAQKRSDKATSSKIQKETNKKIPAAEKRTGIQQIAKKALLSADVNSATGDPCATAVAILPGQTLNGTLSSGDCQLDDGTFIDFYIFDGKAGQPVSVSMNSSNFDTYLFLLDPNGDVLEENDDSGNTTNSRIPMDAGVIILPFTGQYIIGANSLDPATGTYSVTLNPGGDNCAATNISFNQTVSGTLTNADCAVNFQDEIYFTDLYTFSGTAGQQISIAMNSSAVDSFLVLNSPSGKNSVSDDDSGGNLNARIPPSGTFTLPETGIYTIEATSANSLEVGSYTLVLTGSTIQTSAKTRFDYDGDGKTDISVFRPDNGTWYLNQSQNGFLGYAFGISTDKIIPADYDGDGKTDIAVYRSGIWYLQRSSLGFFSYAFGDGNDIPQPADFDGDGKSELVVFRPSNGVWYTFNLASGENTAFGFGQSGDKPVVGDYDGDGKADFAVYRAGIWYLQQSTRGFLGYAFGDANDKPVQADYDGDGKTDIAVFRPLNGVWYVQRSAQGFNAVAFGFGTDVPVAADYDGDGKADIAVFRDGTWYLQQTTAGFTAIAFGAATDKPTPNAFVP